LAAFDTDILTSEWGKFSLFERTFT